MLKIHTTILLLLLLTLECKSQNFYRFRHVGVEDGLSQGSIYHILKDSRGFLWLGTQDGVNRFDGNSIQVYLSGATGESTNVQGIAEDTAANLWVGSHKGLYQYIRKKNKFVRPTLVSAFGEKSVHVFNDRNKHIYILSENGLYSIQGNKTVLISKEIVYDRSQYNNFLAESPDGDLWFLDPQHGLKRYAVTSHKISCYFSDNPNNVYGKPEAFNCIAFDRAGNLWLGNKTGIRKFDYKMNEVHTFESVFGFKNYSIADITQDKNELLWLATETEGILIFDPVRRKLIQRLRHEEDISNSLKFNEVSKLYIDENNDVFANSDPQGLDIITAVSSAFSFYTYGKNPLYNLSGYSVRGIAEDDSAGIWIGSELSGLNRLDAKTGKMQRYNTSDGLPTNTIRYVLKDKKNRIWVANESSLSVFLPKSNRFKQVFLPISSEITTILSLDNDLLLLSTSKGLLLFDSSKMLVTDIASNGLVGGYAAYYDPNTRLIYVSNRHQGIHVFKIENDRVVLKGKFLESFHVLHLYHNPGTEILWAGTDRGLVKWSMKSNKILKNYRIANGLHHEFIYAVLPDSYGRLWLSTNRGLSKFDPQKEKFEFIKEIPPREYNSRSSLVTKKGNLYFGSTTGLDCIRPEMFSIKNDQVKVHLTDIVYDEPDADTGSIYIDEIKSLELPYSNQTILLKFTATDFRSGGMNRYRYFLKGYDEDTIYSGTVDQVRYARLPAGTYEFQLQASDLGGNWVSPVRKLSIKVLPPFWQTWWFVVLVLSIISGIVFLLVRTYLNYRLTEQRLESEKKIFLEKERSRIARDINDSLGSELFGLKLLGQVAMSRTRTDESESYLQKIVDISKSISEKISEVIWVTDSNQDNAESLWSYIQKNAFIYLNPAGIKYHFDPLPENKVFSVSGERRHEMLNFHKLFFIELTKNCAFESCEVRFRTYGNKLIISIINVDIDQMDSLILTNLHKLKGSRIANGTTDILEIPLGEPD